MLYAKTALAGPAAVLDYLARYTHRTAIGNERLVAIYGDTVRWRVRRHHRRQAHHRPGQQFTPGCWRMCCRPVSSASATTVSAGTGGQDPAAGAGSATAAMPAANPQAREDAQAFMRRVAAMEIACCPHCRIGHWRVLQELAADQAALVAIIPTACRGTP